MEKTEITLEYTEERPAFGRAILPKKEPKKSFPWKTLARGLCFCGLGFLWSRMEWMHLLRPAGIAYLSAFFGEGWLFWGVWLAVGAGMVPLVPLKAVAALAAGAAVQMTLGRFAAREEMGKKALLGAFVMVLAGIFFAISRGGLGFYFAVALMEGALTLVVSVLAQKGLVRLLEQSRFVVLSREEVLSLLLLAGGGAAGLTSLALLQKFLLPMAAGILLLFAARQEGIGGGAAAGVFLGFLLLLCDGIGVPMFAALSLGGMLAGAVRDWGRLASAAAMVLSPCVFLFYIEMEVLEPVWVGSLAAGAVLFCLCPKRWLEQFGGLREKEGPADRYAKMQERTEEKLREFSAAFNGLAKTIVQEGERQERGELSRLVDTIAGKVCQGCGLAQYCWQEELYQTYSMTFSALSHCEGKGRVTAEAFPLSFRETCARTDAFVQATNAAYEGYRQDRLWGSRLSECRELVGQQLFAVGDLMQTLSGQMAADCIFLEHLEESLTEALQKQGIFLKKAVVTEETSGRGKEVRLVLPACGGKGVCRDKILPVVRNIVGSRMILQEEGICHHDAAEQYCTLLFREEAPFAMTTATAFSPAEEGTLTGDAAAFLQTERGTMLLALSDGMGTGEAAARESRAAIELLEQFTEAGFEKELAVRMINSALLLRRREETYATLDICHVDLYHARAEFIKLGAVSSYIWRGNRIISLRSVSLPAGILKQVAVEKNEMLLKDGDMIFLLTDGVAEALGGEENVAPWLKRKLNAFPMANPQDAAEYIVREAKKERQEGRKDDMTVLAARFWRKQV